LYSPQIIPPKALMVPCGKAHVIAHTSAHTVTTADVLNAFAATVTELSDCSARQKGLSEWATSIASTPKK